MTTSRPYNLDVSDVLNLKKEVKVIRDDAPTEWGDRFHFYIYKSLNFQVCSCSAIAAGNSRNTRAGSPCDELRNSFVAFLTFFLYLFWPLFDSNAGRIHYSLSQFARPQLEELEFNLHELD